MRLLRTRVPAGWLVLSCLVIHSAGPSSVVSSALAQQARTDPVTEEIKAITQLLMAGNAQEGIKRASKLAEQVKARSGENAQYATILGQLAVAHMGLGKS